MLRQHIEGLEYDRQDNQPQSQVEAEVQVLGFLKYQHGADDAVYRLQVIAQVDRKGGYDFQYLNLEDIKSHGTHRSQAEQVNQILGTGQNRGHREIVQIKRQDAGNA